VPFSNPSANAVLDTGFYGLGIGIIADDDRRRQRSGEPGRVETAGDRTLTRIRSPRGGR
jgi:hypothetical protein